MNEKNHSNGTLKKRLILFPQDKGGIGKSFVALLLYDYLNSNNLKIKAFDLDHANSTFNRFVPEAEFLHTDVEESKLGTLDKIIHSLDDHDAVIVDNRASGGQKLTEYLTSTGLTKLQEEISTKIIFVIVVIDDKDALSQIRDLYDLYGNEVTWLVCRNEREGVSTMWNESQSRKLISEAAHYEITVPALTETTKILLQKQNLTVAKAANSSIPLLDRQRCVIYFREISKQLDNAKNVLLP